MLELEESPPSLHHSPSPPAEASRFNTRDTTPVTPGSSGSQIRASLERDRDNLTPWFKKPIAVGRTTTSLCLDTSSILSDFDSTTFPLFGAAPVSSGMASIAAPLNFSARSTSTSPRGNQPSTLTSALQRNDRGDRTTTEKSTQDRLRNTPQIPAESSNEFAKMEGGSRPIAMKGAMNEKARRESIAQSLGTGMSWGGVSVENWIRDDMMMAGTSPFAFQSPSYHSSSYLPKLEANFMRDFACCGLTLPTLHDLLQHYEEAHAQKDPIHPEPVQAPLPDSRAAMAASTAAHVQQEAQLRDQQQNLANGSGRTTISGSGLQQNHQQRPSAFSSTLQTIPDMDTVEDMEMDDIDGGDLTPPSNMFVQQSTQQSPGLAFAGTAQQPQIPQLNTTMMQGHQAYRQSTPSTPVVPARPTAAFQTTNTSSTLSANPMQQFQDLQNNYRSTPDSSAPGTPGELDETLMSGLDDMTMQNNALFGSAANGFNNFGFGMNSDMIDLCIDEPAKRLFSPGNGPQGQNPGHQRLGSGQYGANSDIARTIRERQVAAGLPDTTTNILPHEEPKPFRCPVIGCEKAYKNQNGLKYHKAHGHNNQRLHDNADGTFSIVDPDTQAPYPGTMGMEKEKPFKCDVCQKRYKNLNGLKYHKTHSPPCNPDLQPNSSRASSVGMAGMMPQHNVSALSGGLSGDHGMM